MVSLFLSGTFWPPRSCFVFLLFLCIFAFPPLSLLASQYNMCMMEYMVRNAFGGHADLHCVQNRGKVSIAEPSPGFPFTLDMKIGTETEKLLNKE